MKISPTLKLTFFLILTSISHNIFSAGYLIGHDYVELSPPHDHCSFENENFIQNQNISPIKFIDHKDATQLMLFTQCEQLHMWQNGDGNIPDSLGYITISNNFEFKKFLMSRKEFVKKFKNRLKVKGVSYFKQAEIKLEKHIPTNFPELKQNQVKSLGILSEDDNAVYLGMFLRTSDATKNNKDLIGIYGMTLVEGKAINFYLWQTAKHTSLKALKENIQQWIRDVIALNKNDAAA